jgi:hypothetical protein
MEGSRVKREGSRFVGWQFYRMVTGGSRELPRMYFHPFVLGRNPRLKRIRHRQTYHHAGSFPGAACLPTDRAATRKSGSPPDALYPPVSLSNDLKYSYE